MMKRLICISLALGAPLWLLAQSPKAAARVGQDLFPDKVIAKGKGVEVKQSQLEEAFLAYRASKAAGGQTVPETMRSKIEEQLLDKMIATQILVSKASDADRAASKDIAEKFIENEKKRAISEEAFQRRLIAEGMPIEVFTAQVHEQALVKAVLDRLLRPEVQITPDKIKKFYEDNPKIFHEPEQARVQHILFSIRDPATGQELSPEEKEAKKTLAKTVLQRIKSGEDFAKIAKQHSDDKPTREKGGESKFSRGIAPPEFEAATWSLQTNQVSDIVTTRLGFHVIKLLEKIPAKQTELAKVEEKIKETLIQEAVEKQLPEFIEKLKKEAGVTLSL